MQEDLSRTSSNRAATNLALARHSAFASLLCSIVAMVTALALDLTFLVPLLAGAKVYSPVRDFLSYQVDEKSGVLMMGVFLLLAVSAWSYAAAAYLAPSRHTNRTTLLATFAFGCGLFVAGCFRAVPNEEIAVDRWLRSVAWLHNIGVGVGFFPALLAAFLDQRRVVFSCPGFVLTKISFWLIVSGGLGTLTALALYPGVAGLTQRLLVSGVVLWLATEAHQLFWSSAEVAVATATPLDDF